MSIEKATIIIVKEVAEDTIATKRFAVTMSVDVTSAVIVIKEATVVKRIEERIVSTIVVVIVEKATMMEGIEEAIAAAEMTSVMMRFLFLVVKTESAKQVIKVEMKTAASEGRFVSTALTERFVAKLVALTPLFRVFQDFVGRADFLKLLLGSLFFVLVWMVFNGEFLEGLFHLLLGRR